MRRARILAIVTIALACTPPSGSAKDAVTNADAAIADAPASAVPIDASEISDASVIDAADASAPAARVSVDEAGDVLFGATIPAGCGSETSDDAKIECWIKLRYGSDAQAKDLALALFREAGDVAGMGKDEMMNGGFRGTIHLVPELPMGTYRKHLEWVLAAARDFESFFRDLYAGQPLPRYRVRALTARFVRSVGRTTPSAYASPWTFTYNVEGSLLKSDGAVRETLFHEMFHMNDDDHGDWSPKNLSVDYQAILKKCGGATAATTPCLTPYAPNDTMVRGSTYYAFQQNNGVPVHEYAAELALRYYKEQRAMLREKKLATKAFKCGPPENARSWNALVSEFFGGRDLVPPCG